MSKIGHQGKGIAEARALQVAADMTYNSLTPAQVKEKYGKMWNLSGKMFDNNIFPRVNAIIRKNADEKYGSKIREAMDTMHESVPEALLILRKAIREVGENGSPTRNAISAADIILRKALPDKIEQKQVVSNPLADELKAMREQLQIKDKKE